jgi:uncharacterized protein
MNNRFGRLAAWAVRHPRPVIVGALALTLLSGLGALRLKSEAATDTLVSHGSETYQATQRFKQSFGDDPVVILVQSQLENLLLTDNLGRLLRLEGCLSGRVPEGQEPINDTCRQIADLNPSQVVFGPATFLNQSAIQAQELLTGQSQAALQEARQAAADAARRARRQGLPEDQQTAAARAAGQEVLAQFQQQVLNLAVRYGQTGPPSFDDPRYISSVVFDTRFAGGVPKEKFSLLFPSPESAQILVQLRPDLTEGERREAIDLFRQAVGEDDFKLKHGSYVVSGIPTVVEGLSSEIEGETAVLLALALAVMALTLTAVLGPPLRLLPLGIALVATATAFGALSLFGGSLTLAALAVLPVLIGLAVDYAIQFQARFREELERRPAERGAAAARAAGRGGPVIATALLATAAGFVVLLLSPIPMIRTFGLLLVLGIALAFGVALTVGFAALTFVPSRPPRSRRRAPRAAPARIEAARAAVGARLRGAGQGAIAAGIATPGRVLSVALVLSCAGWIASTQTDVVTDVRELVPENLPALEDVDSLEQATGVSGQVNVAVEAPDLTDPALIEWLSGFESRVLERHGFGGEFPSCERAELCPGVPLADLFGGGGNLTPQRIRAVLSALPPYFLQAVIAPQTPDSLAKQGAVPGTANVGFQIPVMPLDEQKELIDDIRAQIDPPGSDDDPPPGVEAEVVGTAALAADASSTLSSNRYLLTLAALLAVGAALIAVYRSLARALVPLIPIVLATGWSGLVIEGMDIDLNPISATLGALIIAVSTEFSVILTARYYEERAGGLSIGESLRRTYERTGMAVLASGVTAIAGFAVLPLAAPIEAIFGGQAIPMLTDFGLVTVVDLAVALLGVMLVLPAALVWAEGGFQPLAEPTARIGRRLGGLIPARLRTGSR